jgi:hypothetical protein
MATRWNQITLRFLFFIIIAISCYLAGRMPQIERARIAESQAAAAHARNSSLDHLVRFWQNVALESRADLATEIAHAEYRRVMRPGMGWTGSPGPMWNEQIRPRWLRWKLHLAEDEERFANQLDYFGIKLVAIWRDPPQIHVVSEFSKDVPKVEHDEISYESMMIMPSEEIDWRLVEQAELPADPLLVVRLIPPNLADAIARTEFSHIKDRGLKLEDIQQTDFKVSIDGNGVSIAVARQTRKNKQTNDAR